MPARLRIDRGPGPPEGRQPPGPCSDSGNRSGGSGASDRSPRTSATREPPLRVGVPACGGHRRDGGARRAGPADRGLADAGRERGHSPAAVRGRHGGGRGGHRAARAGGRGGRRPGTRRVPRRSRRARRSAPASRRSTATTSSSNWFRSKKSGARSCRSSATARRLTDWQSDSPWRWPRAESGTKWAPCWWRRASSSTRSWLRPKRWCLLEDAAAAGARWQMLSREARGLTAVLADASRPADDLTERLAAVGRRLRRARRRPARPRRTRSGGPSSRNCAG